MKKHLLFIINPKAGTGKIRTALMDILELFCKKDYTVTVHITQQAREATEITSAYAENVDMIVCSGGDGTLDEVVTGLIRAGSRTPVGYIPMGSTNDFANSLFMPKEPLEVVRNMLQGNIYHCDIGKFNGQTFIYVAAFGLFTDVSYQTPQDMKNVLGHVAYLLEGVSRLFDIRSFRMKVQANGHEVTKDFIYGMISNARVVGGIQNLARNVDMNDGLFEVTLIEMPKNPLELQQVIGALMLADNSCELIHSFKARHIVLDSEEPVDWTLDGEFGGSHQTADITILKQALNLCLTSTKD